MEDLNSGSTTDAEAEVEGVEGRDEQEDGERALECVNDCCRHSRETSDATNAGDGNSCARGMHVASTGTAELRTSSAGRRYTRQGEGTGVRPSSSKLRGPKNPSTTLIL